MTYFRQDLEKNVVKKLTKFCQEFQRFPICCGIRKKKCFEAGQNSENNVEKIVLKTAVSKLFWFCFTAVSKLVCSWFGAGLKLFCSRVLAVFELFSSVLDLHTD